MLEWNSSGRLKKIFGIYGQFYRQCLALHSSQINEHQWILILQMRIRTSRGVTWEPRIVHQKNDWGINEYIISSKNLSCWVWRNLGTTQIMSILHFDDDIQTSEFISSQKWCSICSDSVIMRPDGNETLSISLLICK